MPARPERERKGQTLPAVIRVVLVDGEHVVRQGVGALLGQHDDIEDAGAIAAADVQVVVTDLELPDTRGSDVVAALRKCFSDASILVLTRVQHPTKVRDAIAAGAHGYLLKTAYADDLLVGVRAVSHGETYLQPSLGVALARWSGSGSGQTGGDVAPERLSPKEEEVVRLVALGHTNAEIAKSLGVSLRTIETHRARILQKLGHPSRSELVRYAQNAGLIDLGP